MGVRAGAMLEGRGGTSACALAHGPNPDGLCEWDGRPLRGGRYRWCCDACEEAWAEAHVWTRARAAALLRAAGRCVECGTRARVEVHHDPPVPLDVGYEPGCQHHADHLVVLCREHHQRRHRWLRAAPGEQLALFRMAAARRRRAGRARPSRRAA